MSSAALTEVVAFGKAAGFDSVLISRHGWIVAEAYYAPFRVGERHVLNSATKGVIGTLVGMAAQQGLLDPEQRVLEIFSDRTIANVDDDKRAITIKHLLDMTSGFAWTEPLTGAPETAIEMFHSPDRIQFVLDRPMATPPGATFNYNSGNSHLLSAILTKKTGLNSLVFAQQQLFGPLGIADVEWESDQQGTPLGGRGLHLQPRDMAKIGYLYLRNGSWDGHQMLAPAWIEQIRNATIDMRMFGRSEIYYANQSWTVPGRGAYMSVGFHSQIILVVPGPDLVVVITGHAPPHFAGIFDTLLAAVKSDTPLPANAKAHATLNEAINSAAKKG